MAFNGSGVFNLYSPGNPVVTGTTISSTWANNTLSDIATGLSTCVTKNAQTTTTGVIPFILGISTFGVNLHGSTGSSQIGFVQTGAGAVTQTAQDKLREIVSVKDFGAVGDGVTDDTSAIQDAVDAKPGFEIKFPKGTYILTSAITVSTDNTRLAGYGQGVTNIKQTGANVDAFKFQPTDPTNGTFLNTCGISGMSIYDTTAGRTAGAGVRMTQCNNFRLTDIYVLDLPEGIVQAGGQLNVLDGFEVFASALSGAPIANSQALRFTNQVSGVGHQQAYTTQISNFIVGAGNKLADGILIEGCDGLNFVNGYLARPNDYLCKIKPNVSGKSVSGVSFSNVYFDGVNQTTGTDIGIGVLDDGFAGASLVNDIVIASTCKVGNLIDIGLYSTHPNIKHFTIDPASFLNCGGDEIDITGGDTGGDSWIGAALPWTPALTFATPGDLAVTYDVQAGSIVCTKDGMVHASFSITTSGFTHTTASGDIRVSGLPIAATSETTVPAYGSLAGINGVTKANYTQFTPRIDSTGVYLNFRAAGSAQAASTITASDTPTGGTIVLAGTICYRSGEVY